MTRDTRGPEVVARIGFAERWLRRAKRQCVRGDITRGLLTLVLAEAEMHYAIETRRVPAKGPAQRIAASAILAVAAGAAVVAVLAVSLPSAPPALSAVSTPPIVKFATPVGALLDLVQAPSAMVPAPVAAVAVPQVTPRGSRLMIRPARSAPSSQGPLVQATPTVSVSPATGAVSPQPIVVQVVQRPTGLLISDIDLIDLTIAAERTLRSVPATP